MSGEKRDNIREVWDFYRPIQERENPLFIGGFEGVGEAKVSLLKLWMVEVGGVEPPSGKVLVELLRVYRTFDHGCGTPVRGLCSIHPFGSASCSGQAELPAAWPAGFMPRRLADIGASTSRRKV